MHRLLSCYRLLGTALVCGGLLGAVSCGPAENVVACRAYVDAANQAHRDCNNNVQFDPDTECPAELDEGPDCTLYYQCLESAYSCDQAAMVVVANTTNCSCTGS